MIMDNVGLLSSLYQYADIVYVGGGFGSAVHNTLEPAVWGKPIIVGPNNKKFYEVQLLKSSGGLFQVNTYEEMLEKISTLLSLDELDLLRIGVNNKKLIESNIGSTNKILMEINTILNS
jgi:3-deoxy-D-manno-octulosonic-acid transferase